MPIKRVKQKARDGRLLGTAGEGRERLSGATGESRINRRAKSFNKTTGVPIGMVKGIPRHGTGSMTRPIRNERCLARPTRRDDEGNEPRARGSIERCS